MLLCKEQKNKCKAKHAHAHTLKNTETDKALEAEVGRRVKGWQ